MAGPSLHVGLFSPLLPKSGVANGIITYVRYMRDALRKAGHRVTIVAADGIEDSGGRERPAPNRLRLRDRPKLIEARLRPDWHDLIITTLLTQAAFRDAHSAEPFDVFEMEESFGWAGALMGMGAPIVARLHGPHVYGRDAEETAEAARLGDKREIAEGRALGRVSALTSPSARLLDATLAHYRAKPHLAEVIPNPIAALPPAETWRLDGCDIDQLLCVGRFDTRKGADIVLQAFQQASARHPTLTLVMAGPDYGLATRAGPRINFADYVRGNIRPEIAARIRFLGNVPPDEILALRRQSALSIIGSRFENFPYSLAEAMAVGTTSIVSDSFGNAEMTLDGETGLVVPVGDAGAMAAAIVALRDHPQRIAAMADAAYRRCVDWLDPDRVAADTVALYRRAMAGSRS